EEAYDGANRWRPAIGGFLLVEVGDRIGERPVRLVELPVEPDGAGGAEHRGLACAGAGGRGQRLGAGGRRRGDRDCPGDEGGPERRAWTTHGAESGLDERHGRAIYWGGIRVGPLLCRLCD